MRSTIKEQFNKIFFLKSTVIIVLWAGILLRVFHFIYNRSLWMDEVYLSSSFSHTSFKGFATELLDYGQKAPLGFLWLVKLSIVLLGYTEFALRSIPFISSIASIFLWYKLCKSYLNETGQLVALSIFCFAPALIYHSVEIKQYSTELFTTVVVLYLYSVYQTNQTWRANLAWGLYGALCIWFSFPVIFILLGIIIYSASFHLIKRDFSALTLQMTPFTIWIVSFLLNYVLYTQRHTESSKWVVYFFKTYDNFLPLFPNSIPELKWYVRNYFQLFDYPLGLVWNYKDFNNISLSVILQSIIPSILLFTGVYTLNKKKSGLFYSCLTAILLLFIASGLHLYPLGERFWVFICPALILFIAYGAEFYMRKNISRIATYAIVAAIVIIPLSQSIYQMFNPAKFYKHKKSYVKEALLKINQNLKDGDVVYNYWNNAPGYSVYKNILPLKYKAIQGRDFRKSSSGIQEYNGSLLNDLSLFKGRKRLWLIYNTQFLTDIGDLIDDPLWYYKTPISPEANLMRVSSFVGKPIGKFVYSDVTICLFELGGFPAKKIEKYPSGI